MKTVLTCAKNHHTVRLTDLLRFMVITQVSMARYDLSTHGTILLSKVNIKEINENEMTFTYIRFIYMSMQPLQNL